MENLTDTYTNNYLTDTQYKN